MPYGDPPPMPWNDAIGYWPWWAWPEPKPAPLMDYDNWRKAGCPSAQVLVTLQFDNPRALWFWEQ